MGSNEGQSVYSGGLFSPGKWSIIFQ
jgi:hypothetical protein